MASFDWPQFLRRYQVEYVTSGPNVAKGFIGVKCPYCGEADPSEHMSIELRGRFWRCWRHPSHSGKSKARLIKRLIRCTEEEAQRLAGEDVPVAPDNTELMDSLNQLRGSSSQVKEPLELPREFKPLISSATMARGFIEYMHQRGYRLGEIKWLAEAYDLRYTVIGDFAWRLIIPVRDRQYKLQTWTGRAIGASIEPRYKTLSVNDGPALVSTSNTLLGQRLLFGAPIARALIICEGPFDAMRLMASGFALGVYATCLFGLNVSLDQRALLQELAERFDRIYLLIDTAAELQKLGLAQRLSPLKLEGLSLPSGVKDPGDLSAAQAAALCLDLVS